MKIKDQYDIVFAVIAPREVEFFRNIADHLKTNFNLNCGFITFYEPGDRHILKKGYTLFSLHKNVNLKHVILNGEIITKLEKKFGAENLRKLILHEKLTFNRYNEEKLFKKVIAYDKYFSEILKKNNIKNVVQELGGFIAPLTLFYNCLYYKVNHIFIEPSMYKGRLFFNHNSLEVKLKKYNKYTPDVINRVKQYITDYNKNKYIVIPAKDKANFLDAGIKKLLQKRYMKRFIGKMYSKYVKKEKEEYNAIFNQVRNFLLMFVRRKFMSYFYSQPNYNEKYLYFPLHVPLDFQLTVREPMYLNQLALIENISNILPYGIKLYIKEHPASIGGYNYWELRRILKNDNIKLIHPQINSYDLINNSLLVITINSKVGVETLMQGKRVAVLGNPYYTSSKLVNKLKSIDALISFFRKNKIYNKDVISLDYNFFYAVYKNSFKGELYLNTDENIKTFSDNLWTIVKKI